eukprot:jgi/Mesen1/4153/ME000219S03282
MESPLNITTGPEPSDQLTQEENDASQLKEQIRWILIELEAFRFHAVALHQLRDRHNEQLLTLRRANSQQSPLAKRMQELQAALKKMAELVDWMKASRALEKQENDKLLLSRAHPCHPCRPAGRAARPAFPVGGREQALFTMELIPKVSSAPAPAAPPGAERAELWERSSTGLSDVSTGSEASDMTSFSAASGGGGGGGGGGMFRSKRSPIREAKSQNGRVSASASSGSGSSFDRAGYPARESKSQNGRVMPARIGGQLTTPFPFVATCCRNTPCSSWQVQAWKCVTAERRTGSGWKPPPASAAARPSGGPGGAGEHSRLPMVEDFEGRPSELSEELVRCMAAVYRRHSAKALKKEELMNPLLPLWDSLSRASTPDGSNDSTPYGSGHFGNAADWSSNSPPPPGGGGGGKPPARSPLHPLAGGHSGELKKVSAFALDGKGPGSGTFSWGGGGSGALKPTNGPLGGGEPRPGLSRSRSHRDSRTFGSPDGGLGRGGGGGGGEGLGLGRQASLDAARLAERANRRRSIRAVAEGEIFSIEPSVPYAWRGLGSRVLDPYGVLGDHPCPDAGHYGAMLEVERPPLEEGRGPADELLLSPWGLYGSSPWWALALQLEVLTPEAVSGDQKLAFWINLYNALLMHTYMVHGVPKNQVKRVALMAKAALTVGGHHFTALSIEHTVLRACSHRPSLEVENGEWRPGDCASGVEKRDAEKWGTGEWGSGEWKMGSLGAEDGGSWELGKFWEVGPKRARADPGSVPRTKSATAGKRHRGSAMWSQAPVPAHRSQSQTPASEEWGVSGVATGEERGAALGSRRQPRARRLRSTESHCAHQFGNGSKDRRRVHAVEMRAFCARVPLPSPFPPLSAPPQAKLLPVQKFKPTDERSRWVLTTSEPLVSFALVNGCKSSPALRVYSGKSVRAALEKAKHDYLLVAVGIDSSSKILLPKLLDWYGKDFASNHIGLLSWIVQQLPRPQQTAVADRLPTNPRTVASKCMTVVPYDWSFRYLLDATIAA